MSADQLDLMQNWLAACLVLLIPGLTILAWLPGRYSRYKDVFLILADGIALSISVVALLALWFSLAQIRIGATWIGLLYFAAIAGAFVGWLRKGRFFPNFNQIIFRVLGVVPVFALLIGMIAWRLYQARDLVLPAWVDSAHHVLIVRKILEFGGLPPDLTPYIPVTFFYHYGFHIVAALFALITRQAADQSILWFGQVVNAVVALSVYRAALAVWNNTATEQLSGETESQPMALVSMSSGFAGSIQAKAIAIISAVLVGFAFYMPAYYVTWGRYTLLAGLVLLGPAVASACEMRQEPHNIASGVKLALLTAGLCMTHYFALLLFALFLVFLGSSSLIGAIRQPVKRVELLKLVCWTGFGVLLALPWVWKVGVATMDTAALQMIVPSGQEESAWKSAVDYLKYMIRLVGPLHSHILMGLAGFGLLIALRRSGSRILAVWAIILLLLCLPWGPRFGPFRPDHFAIVLFFPAAILTASCLVSCIEILARVMQPGGLESKWFRPVLIAVMLVVFGFWGMRQNKNVLNDSTILVSKSDKEALDWIKANTMANARFYINSIHWQGRIYRGVDGGYWLMPYTGRASLLPPALYESGSDADIERINRLAEKSSKVKGCVPDFWDIVHEAQLTHVYLHRGRGVLQPEGLDNCDGLYMIYQHDEIVIYEIEATN